MTDPPPSAAPTIETLLTSVDRALSQAFPERVWVHGEVSDPVVYDAWARCTLLQPVGDELISLRLFLPREHLPAIRASLAPTSLKHALSEGQTIAAGGRIRRSVLTGHVELHVERLAAQVGEGLLAQRRREIQQRLQAERLLDRQRTTRHLPLAPLRVGLVSGASSDGLRDAQQILAGSGYRITSTSYPVRLEGRGAAKRIAHKITEATGSDHQLVLVVRGGGASSALHPFDTEPVARAIATAPIPVITGIGHERHSTLADAVALQAGITPTGAAQAVIRQLEATSHTLQDAAETANRAGWAAQRTLQQQQTRRRQLASGVGALAAAALAAAVLTTSWPLAGVALVLALAAVLTARTSNQPPTGEQPRPEAPTTLEEILTELDAIPGQLTEARTLATVEALTNRTQRLQRAGEELLRGHARNIPARAPGWKRPAATGRRYRPRNRQRSR